MIVRLLNQGDIDSLLMNIGQEIREIDTSIEIMRFGSSLQRLPADNVDIDIVLLSDKDYLGEKIASSIRTLRSALINGKHIIGFDTEVPQIAEIVRKIIRCSDLTKVNYIPKFVFGPLEYIGGTRDKVNIFLHFKGPLTKAQFQVFCEEMPLHAYSLIQNYMPILASTNLSNFKKNISLNRETLYIFNGGLKIRVENSDSRIDIIKCIGKLLLNHQLFPDNKLEVDYPCYSSEKLRLKSMANLKATFVKLFTELNPDITSSSTGKL